MNSISVLDVTLRDGGCVNNFDFGHTYMEKILAAQENAGIDIIELGYLDEIDGSSQGRTKYKNEKVITQYFLRHKKPETTYVAMIDFGKFDVYQLKKRENSDIDGIRLAFHKKDRFEAIKWGKAIISKGYELYLQPMITLRYSDDELKDFIECVNRELNVISGFYIVDSFGEMRSNDMLHLLNVVNSNLLERIPMGIHSHNNLQMSYSNAITFLQYQMDRKLIIDCSIMGMGKGAGNLNTELLIEHLNIYYGKKYHIQPLLEVMDKVLNQLRAEFFWGYSPEYYLSAINKCSPSYASHFYNRHMLPIDQVGELLGMIEDHKKISFDKKYAEDLYRKYNDRKPVNDDAIIMELQQEFKQKCVLLVAPGKSILNAMEKIREIAAENNVITIGLNTLLDFNDYTLTSRKEVYEEIVAQGNRKIIACSNISKGGRGNVMILNYANWIDIDEATHDSSFVIALNLLKHCGVKEVMLAGLDGFDSSINENYYDPIMRHPVSPDEASKRNDYYKSFITRAIQDGMSISFVTDSKYMSDTI